MAADDAVEQSQELTHLGFVRTAAIRSIVFVWAVYDYAKQNSGSFKPTVERVEGAVSAVVLPVYDKFKDVPNDVLVFLDGKVDVATTEFDQHAPPLAKQVVGQAQHLVLKAAEVAKEIFDRAQAEGPVDALLYVFSETKQVALDQTVKVYSKLDQVPSFHALAQLIVPLIAFWSAKYNSLVSDASGRYPLFSYVPLIPVDDIAEAYKQTAATKHANGTALLSNGAKNE
ncbi:REF/SRPP-like protein [Drosera capensis]